MTGFYTKCCTGLKWVKMTKATVILGKMNQIKFKLLDHFNGYISKLLDLYQTEQWSRWTVMCYKILTYLMYNSAQT